MEEIEPLPEWDPCRNLQNLLQQRQVQLISHPDAALDAAAPPNRDNGLHLGVGTDFTRMKSGLNQRVGTDLMYSPDNLDLCSVFLENTPKAMAMVDREMRYLLATRQWLNECGFGDRTTSTSPEATAVRRTSIVGRSFYEIWPRFHRTQQHRGETSTAKRDRDLERWRTIQAKVLAGEVQKWEEQYPISGDRIQRVKWEAHPWKTPTGEVGGLLLSRDSTAVSVGVPARRSRSDESDLRRQSQVLVELARSKTQSSGNLEQAIAEIAEAAADTLSVERVGVWLYDDANSRMTCINLYERTQRSHSCGSILPTESAPNYLQALETERAIAADKAISDPRTSELADSYLIPLGITSKLDVPIRIGGKLIGVVCCEAIGTSHHWKLGERNFAASIGDYTALALETHDRTQTQQELEAANDQLQAVLDAVPGSISWFSSDLIYLGVNGYLAETFNANPETFIGRKIGFLHGSPKFNQLVPEFFANPDTEARYEIEMSVRGVNRHFLVVAHKYQQGKAGVFIGFDITERRAAEAALAKAKEELEQRVKERTKDLTEAIDQLQDEIRTRNTLEETRDVLEFSINNAADSVFWLTPDGRFFYVNDAACITLGYSREELLSLSVHDINLDLPAQVWPEYWDEIKEFGSVRLEARHRTKEGNTFPVEITINYFQVNRKEYNCIFARDITESKRVEEELQRSKIAAEAANLAKSGFLANMSHELRTPLTTIISYSDLLQEDAKELGVTVPDFFIDLQNINKAGQDLLVTVDDILDYSKIELGRMDLDVSCFEIGEAIAEVEARIEHKLVTNNNQLIVECDRELGTIWSDRAKLEQILWHLLDNATKFTENGQIYLEVMRETTPDFRVLSSTAHIVGSAAEPPEEWIAFRVRDTGIGMSPEQIQELFEPFHEVDSAIARRYAGSGLGLALSRSLCQLMGGDLLVESDPGVGSTFTIYLPAHLQDNQTEMTAEMPELETETSSFLGGEDIWDEEEGWVFDED